MVSLIFFGSSSYSVIVLQSLLGSSKFQPVAVVTKPDKPVGRDQKVTPNPVSDFARQHNLPLLQPTEFTAEFKQELSRFKADLGLCVAFGPPFFDQEMIDLFPYQIVNIHPSPLPFYRGATPGPWQIINGETKSAATFFVIDDKPDHGPLITSLPFEISSTETADSFYVKAFSLAAAHLETVLDSYIQNPKKLTPQDHTLRTYFPRLDKDQAQINWSWDAPKIERFIRALTPWPIAWTLVRDLQGRKLRLKVFSGKIINEQLVPQDVQLENKTATTWDQIEKYYQLVK